MRLRTQVGHAGMGVAGPLLQPQEGLVAREGFRFLSRTVRREERLSD